MSDQQHYIATQQVTAVKSFRDDAPGMAVRLPDGTGFWQRLEAFESMHLAMGTKDDGEPNKNVVTPSMVKAFIAKVEVRKVGLKTTTVLVTCVNGFEMLESSSCIDPKDYDEKKAAKHALRKIKKRLWECLGFLVQTGRYGVAAVPVDAR